MIKFQSNILPWVSKKNVIISLHIPFIFTKQSLSILKWIFTIVAENIDIRIFLINLIILRLTRDNNFHE